MRVRLAVILTCGLLTACTSSRVTIDSYIDPAYSRAQIRSVAVLPVANPAFSPGEALELNRRVTMAIAARNSALRVLGAGEVVTALNQHNLAGPLGAFLDNFATSGIPDSSLLQRVGQALGVDVLIQGQLLNVLRQDGRAGFAATPATTRVTVRFVMLDCRLGRMIWQASSEGTRLKSGFSSAAPLIEAVNPAIDKILATLPF